MKWFKHDSKANQDAKLKRVRIKYGMEGYGLYWYCIEMVAVNVEQNRLTFDLEHDAEIIAFDTGIHYERVQEMMTFMVNLGLFEDSGGVITCLKLAKRADEYTAKYLKTQLNKIQSIDTTDNIGTKSTPNDIKRDEIKKNKISNKPKEKRKRFIQPELHQVTEYMFERTNDQHRSATEAARFCDYYIANGWKVGRNKMVDWKATARNWLSRNIQSNQRVRLSPVQRTIENVRNVELD